MELPESDQVQQRRKNLEAIIELGHEPYPRRFDRTHTVSQIVKEYGHHAGTASPEETEAKNKTLQPVRVRTAGRMKTNRLMGKAAFAHLSDGIEQLQVYLRKDQIGEDGWTLYKLLDLGDHIGVEGYLFITRTGELSVHVEKIEFLAKALLPMPDKYHGLHDVEIRQRQRYADLIANRETRQVFERRAQIIREIRRFMDDHGYMEVETPMLSPMATGAAARPFKTHHNALDLDLFARIAPELYLKRLTVGGIEKVYELNRNFRNEGLSFKHNPEFTMLEFYEAYSDMQAMIDFTREMLMAVVDKVTGSRVVEYQGQQIDFGDWRVMTMREAVCHYWPEPLRAAGHAPSPDDLDGRERCNRWHKLWLAWDDRAKIDSEEERVAHAVEAWSIPGAVIVGGADGKPRPVEELQFGESLGALFEGVAEEHLIQPTFIIEFPTELSPLSKQVPGRPQYVERFELFIAGMELANAFSELNDPVEQRRRFEEQMRKRAAGDEEAMMLDEDYIRALSYGMPPTGGEGVGIDRLVMILTNQRSIREVILFPHHKPE